MTDRRVAVVTGASSGIGKALARALAADGWRVIGTGRDPARTAAAATEIGGGVTMLRADLSLLAEARALAAEIGALTDRVDLLVNNAGGMTDTLAMTPEGLEASFAANHLGPFVLTDRLLPLLRRAAEAKPAGHVRILMTASDASEMLPALDPGDLQGLAGWSPGRAYCTAKLANMLFARALAARLGGEGIVAHAVHPGAVDSNFFTHAPADTRARTQGLPKATEAEGADTLHWLATAAEGAAVNGGYWHHRRPRAPNPLALDDALVARVWEESARLVGQAGA